MTTHDRLREELGWEVTGTPPQVRYGANPRPATREEELLWIKAVYWRNRAEGAETALRNNNEAFIEQMRGLGADNKSLQASCEAYQAQLKKLYDFLAHEYPNIQPTDDAIEFAMAELQKSFGHECEPQKKSMVEILDARAAKDPFGTPADPKVGGQ